MVRVPAPSFQHLFANHIAEPVGLVASDDRNEVYRQPELVRTLKRSRFRGAFSHELQLPLWAAECLEDLEAGLRDAGFMRADQKIAQDPYAPFKFRVETPSKRSANRHSSSTNVFDVFRDKIDPALSTSAVGVDFVKPPTSMVVHRNRPKGGALY